MDYTCTRWLKLRERVLRRDKYMCQYSKRYGKHIQANTVHHIMPADQYPQYEWCEWNLISLCSEAHNKMHDRNTNELTEEGKRLQKRVKQWLV